jgi:predicted transcriptional regulator
MAIRLDNTAPIGYLSKQSAEAARKRQIITEILSTEPITAVEIAAATNLAEPTVRHHLHIMEKRGLVLAKVMRNIVGDSAKRYFHPDTDLSKLNVERMHRNKFAQRLEKMCEFMHNNVRHKQEIADEFGLKRKYTEQLLNDLVAEGKLKVVMVKQYPWRAASSYFVTSWSDDKMVEDSKYLVERKYIHYTKQSFQASFEIVEKPSILPDLPTNLLSMMGYTSVKPEQGQRFNVDEYSAKHPDWNKYQSRKGTQYSQYGSSMRYFESEAGV